MLTMDKTTCRCCGWELRREFGSWVDKFGFDTCEGMNRQQPQSKG